MAKIVTSTGKGSAINQSEHDVSLNAMGGINVVESGTTLDISIIHQGATVEMTSSSSKAISIDPIGGGSGITDAADTTDFEFTVHNSGSGTCTITADTGTDTINGGTTSTTVVLLVDEFVTLQTANNSGEWNAINNGFYRSSANTFSGNNTFTGNNTFNEDLTLSTANLVVSSGNGIDFSATSDASGKTSELFDDYEEGTFTPTVEGTTSGEATYGTPREGFYTKIGNAVKIQLAVKIATSGTMSGNIKVGGLPFSEGAFGNGASVSVGYGDALNITAGYNLGGRVQGAAINMNIWNAATGIAALSTALLSADGHFELTATYYV